MRIAARPLAGRARHVEDGPFGLLGPDNQLQLHITRWLVPEVKQRTSRSPGAARCTICGPTPYAISMRQRRLGHDAPIAQHRPPSARGLRRALDKCAEIRADGG